MATHLHAKPQEKGSLEPASSPGVTLEEQVLQVTEAQLTA